VYPLDVTWSPDPPSHLSPVDTSPVGVSLWGSSSPWQLPSWRTLHGEGSPASSGRPLADALLFEVTEASVVQDAASKHAVSSKTPKPTAAHIGLLRLQPVGKTSTLDFYLSDYPQLHHVTNVKILIIIIL